MKQIKITQSYTIRGGAVDWYLSDISGLDRITPEEEVELAMKIQRGDEEARKRLVEANLRFVVSVAKQYQGHGFELVDLINEGNIGLLKAAERFDPTRGFKFISYAVCWIRQAILQAISEQSRMVRLPLNQTAQINKILKEMTAFTQLNGREPSAEELEELTGFPASKISESLGLTVKHMSLDSPLGDEGDSGTLLDVHPDKDSPEPDEGTTGESLRTDLVDVMQALNERERDIILWSFGIGCEEISLEEIAEKLDLTRERVRQLRERAVRKLAKSGIKDRLRQYL